MGRHGRKFTPEELKAVEDMAFVGCTDSDICAILNISPSSLRQRFPQVLKTKRAQKRRAILTAQMNLAIEEKNVAMLIWRGKQDLGQTDKIQTEDTNRDVSSLSDEELIALRKGGG